jgi:hypothetical protein
MFVEFCTLSIFNILNQVIEPIHVSQGFTPIVCA